MSSTDSGLVVTRKQMGSIPILSCEGEIWFLNKETFREHLTAVVSKGVKCVGIDMDKVGFIDSSFFRSLLIVKRDNPDVEIVCRTTNQHDVIFKLLDAKRLVSTTKTFSFS